MHNEQTLSRRPNPSISGISGDAVWDRIRAEALETAAIAPTLASMVRSRVLCHADLGHALAHRLVGMLADVYVTREDLRNHCLAAYSEDPGIVDAARADILAVLERDPATRRMLQPFLFFKGFRAIQAYRLAHWLINTGQSDLAFYIQMQMSDLFAIDIHPSAKIGHGLMIDHAHGIVIGETSTIGNNVTLLHSVTLGGTGKQSAARHPSIGDDVVIGAGAKILGNIHVGRGAKIAAGSVVLRDVPDYKTVVGVPGRVVESKFETYLDHNRVG